MIGQDQEKELLARLDAWDPDQGDLPDDLALAIDENEVLRERFDARFARWEAPPVEVPDDLPRLIPARPAWRRWALPVAVALAASAALAVGLGSLAVLSTGAFMSMAPTSVSFESTASAPVASSHARQEEGSAKAGKSKSLPVRERRANIDHGLDTTIDLPNGDPSGVTDADGFADVGINGWSTARAEPLSTFSIDVDRGSYTFGRRMLRSGYLPDPASVRVEEYVNSLVYDYPQPDEGPFAVQFEASPSPWNDARYIVRIGVQGREPPVRLPVHLTFLVDTSGSMSGPDRLPLVQQALHLLVPQLRDGDTVALVAYAGSVGVVLPPTSATEPQTILRAVDRLQSGGGTAMGQGIEAAYRLAEQTRRLGSTNRVILASDGDANVGVTDTGALSELIRRYASEGIALTTLGFGEGNYKDARMEQLADQGDGNYYYVDGIDEARRVFVDELTSTLEVIARDVKIQVDWNSDAIARYRLLGYENRALRSDQFRDDRVDAGEVGAGASVTALYAVELVPGSATPLATVRIRSKPPGPDAASTERTFSFPRGALDPSFADASPDHRMAVASAVFAERLRNSPYTVGIRYQDLEAIARGAARGDHPQDLELLGLIDLAMRLTNGEQTADVARWP